MTLLCYLSLKKVYYAKIKNKICNSVKFKANTAINEVIFYLKIFISTIISKNWKF